MTANVVPYLIPAALFCFCGTIWLGEPWWRIGFTVALVAAIAVVWLVA